MRIILSTDFTEDNEALFPYAIDLLRTIGGEIIVFHAYMDQCFVSDSSYPGNFENNNIFTSEFITELESTAREEMEEKKRYLTDLIKEENLDNISVESVLVGGEPESELIRLADMKKPDLILMGTRGKGKKRFLEGSLAKSVMTKIKIPLLSIPIGYHWRKSTDILYATNFGKFDICIIEQIFEILRPYSPHIHVVHFVSHDDSTKESLLMEELSKAFETKEYEGDIHFQLIHTGNPAEALRIFCERNDISLTSFVAYRKGLLDYIFRDKLDKDDFFNLGLPMLTFKDID